MGQIIYEIVNGVPNFTVSLIPDVAPDQIQTGLGIYSFDDIPNGFYSVVIVDAVGCRKVLLTSVNVDECILEGLIICELDCNLDGVLECIPSITTTTTTTVEGICPDCPPGYTAVIGACYKEDIISPTAPITPQYLYPKNNIRYGTIGTIVFAPGWNYDGSGSVYNVYTTGSFWRNPLITSIYGSTVDGVMNKNAVWSGVTLDYQIVGFPICIDIAEEKTYLVGMACDNFAEVKIDGVSVLYQDPTALYAIYTANGWSIPSPAESTFRAWYIYPINLSAGKHIIELIGHNDTSVAAVGLDIYDMTEADLMACNSYADMGAGLLFSTKDEVGNLVKIGNEGQGYTCPEGYILGYCDDSPMCYKLDYLDCGEVPPTTTTITTTELIVPGLKMLWNNIVNVPVPNPASVSDWNDYFYLPVLGTPFDNISVVGTSPCEITLYGGSIINIGGNLFGGNDSLLSFIDEANCIISVGEESFRYATALTIVSLPAVTAVGLGGFGNCWSIATIYLPSCTDLGTTTGDNLVFSGISALNITLTISSSLMTCNGGSPDGDIQYLQANNTVTVITV